VTFGSALPVEANCTELNGVVTCDLVNLTLSSTTTITINVSPTQEGTITNSVHVSSDTQDNIQSNNVAQAIVTVVPANVNPPVAKCQDVIKTADTNCLATATANEVDNGSFDPDGDAITLRLNPEGPFPTGSNTVTLIVTDATGLSNTCSATVFVTESTAPTVSCPADITVTALVSQVSRVVTFSATATDNCPPATAACNPPSGTAFAIGTTAVTCTATDTSGNTSAPCSFNVTVVTATTGGDSDNDGVPDDQDQCPNTPPGEVVNAQGCSISQLVPCEGPREGGTWRNHGEYVSAVARVSRDFKRKSGLITADERAQIMRAAANSDCGRRGSD
jgi:hypothetical protein